jgi:hypothetical protein
MQAVKQGRGDRTPLLTVLHKVLRKRVAGLHGVDPGQPQLLYQPTCGIWFIR